MKTQDAIKFYGSQKALKEVLGLSARQTIHAWGEFPPMSRQWQLEVMTDGKLRAERKQDAGNKV